MALGESASNCFESNVMYEMSFFKSKKRGIGPAEWLATVFNLYIVVQFIIWVQNGEIIGLEHPLLLYPDWYSLRQS